MITIKTVFQIHAGLQSLNPPKALCVFQSWISVASISEKKLNPHSEISIRAGTQKSWICEFQNLVFADDQKIDGEF
jgi:hypothetical protein